MTKGTKIFRIITCILLAITLIWSAILIIFAGNLVLTAKYNIYVAGTPVIRANKDDVLGDGTVYYDSGSNTLVFDNATIRNDSSVVHSMIDLNIELIGENKFICENDEYCIGIYAGDGYLGKDLSFVGDGSLTIELQGTSGEAAGVFASDITVTTDITVKTSDCENKVNGIVSDSSLLIVNKATVTVDNGSAKNSVGVRVRGNALFEEGTALNVSVNPGTTEICKGLSVSGDIFLGKDTSLEVSCDDESTDLGECIHVSGLMEIGAGSTVTASSKNAHAIECFGTIEANKGAVISAVSNKKDADILCHGAVVNYGADIAAEVDAIGGIHNRVE